MIDILAPCKLRNTNNLVLMQTIEGFFFFKVEVSRSVDSLLFAIICYTAQKKRKTKLAGYKTNLKKVFYM